MTHNRTLEIIPYRVEFGLETVKMMRESFHTAMSVQHQNRFDDLKHHLEFFSQYDPSHVHIVLDTEISRVVGCMVLNAKELEQLYIHVHYQRVGIGGQLMALAKTLSPNGLELYAFNQNKQAQNFYHNHSFIEVSRGFASQKGNSWATTKEQLADIRFAWLPSPTGD